MLLGTTVAVFISGTQSSFAMAAFFSFAGLAALITRPTAAPSRLAVALAVLFCALSALSLLPLEWFSVPAWRTAFPENSLVQLGSTLAAMPSLVWFWWLVLVGTCLVGGVLLTAPLEGRALANLLHLVAAVVAVYAALAMVDRVTPWTYPFSDNAPFGFLPNRNHTATLLFVGAIVSFGLMQWELTHGRPTAAALAALCAAPPMAALLFFSISRAGVACLAVGLLLWACGTFGTVARRKSVVITVVVLGMFLAGLFVVGGSEVRNRLGGLWNEVLATDASGDGAQPMDFRQPVFSDTAAMIADSPWAGVGLDHFAAAFPHYRKASARAVLVLHPESDWLMVAAETGVPSALILAALAAWFLVRCWKARGADDGLLRWTVASAVGAALIHGIIDVPWHRPAVGWFLLVVALASVPPSGFTPRFPSLCRAGLLIIGLSLLAGGIYLGWQTTTDRPPWPYRWSAYTAEMDSLAKRRLNEDGLIVSTEAVRDFPFEYQAHYWRMAFLRTFPTMEPEMAESSRMGLFVEPVLPQVAAEQAWVWANVDPTKEAESWVEAILRTAKIDRVEGRASPGGAEGQIRSALDFTKDAPDVQLLIGRRLASDPALGAVWFRWAAASPAAELLAGIPDLPAYLDLVPNKLRREVLERLVTLPDPSRAVAYMEARNSPSPGPYWRALARHYAAVGDKPAAVAKVAQAAGVDLATRGRGLNDFGSQLAELEAQGNDVAVRRLLSEAASPGQKDTNKLAVAMAWFAAAGDWEKSWQAASRLASEIKIED